MDTFSAGAAGGGQVIGGTVPTGVRDPRVTAHESIHDAGFSLFDIIEVHFVEIGFDTVSGQKPEARVKMNITDPLVFDGPLEFLNG